MLIVLQTRFTAARELLLPLALALRGLAHAVGLVLVDFCFAGGGIVVYVVRMTGVRRGREGRKGVLRTSFSLIAEERGVVVKRAVREIWVRGTNERCERVKARECRRMVEDMVAVT